MMLELEPSKDRSPREPGMFNRSWRSMSPLAPSLFLVMHESQETLISNTFIGLDSMVAM